MSWLIGSSKSGDSGDKNLPKENNEENGKKAEQGGLARFKFESDALERAAKSARELEKSPHANKAFEITKLQEITRQKELETKAAEFVAQSEGSKIEAQRMFHEERRKTLSEETKQNQVRAEYQDRLARKRYSDQLAQQTRMNQDNLQKQEESTRKQEAIRRQTVEQESQLRLKTDLKRIKAEMEGRAKVDRENKDITMEKIRLKAVERRKTILESIGTIGNVVGSGVNSMFRDWDKMVAAVMGVSLAALGVYSAKFGTGVIARKIENKIGKPSLICETSRINIFETFTSPIKTIRKLSPSTSDPMSGVIIEPKVEERLRDIAISTGNTQMNRGWYRNILFYGPPGVGKTLFAKKLAKHSGMEYAIMTGGDVAPMGRVGVNAIHKVFDWANTSNKGLLLLVDEADAFLRKRSSTTISEDLRASLNAFLYRSSEQSSKIMLVFASNHPEQFDWAINDRIDEMVSFQLPGTTERERILRMYFDTFILGPIIEKKTIFRRKSRLKLDSFDYGQICKDVAEKTDGFSGRELSKLVIGWQASAYASESGILTKEIIYNMLQHALQAHSKKDEWVSSYSS